MLLHFPETTHTNHTMLPFIMKQRQEIKAEIGSPLCRFSVNNKGQEIYQVGGCFSASIYFPLELYTYFSKVV